MNRKRTVRRLLLMLVIFVFFIGSQPNLAFATHGVQNVFNKTDFENFGISSKFKLGNILNSWFGNEEEYISSAYEASYTQSRMIPGNENPYKVQVKITNITNDIWKAEDFVLSYHWTLPDGEDVTKDGNRLETSLPEDIAPGKSITVTAEVKTPIQSSQGNHPDEYILKWDFYHQKNKEWLSENGGPKTGDYPVVIEDPASNGIGLEKFYQYLGKNTGAGSTAMVNLHNGNMVFSYDPFNNPGLGLSTFIRFTYNSLDTSDSPLGHGWTISASNIMKLGSPLEFIGNGNKPPREVTLTDGDGTRHVFYVKDPKADKPEYVEPAGVNLYLEMIQTDKKERQWIFTRSDRTQFIFDEDGYQVATRDKNGNEMQFVYEERHSNKKPTKFLTALIDPSKRETLKIDYYTKDETKNPKILDKIKTIKDISGRTLEFTYNDKSEDVRNGTLAQITDGAGTKDAKIFQFDYDSKSIHTKMVSAVDPRGNKTEFHYIENGKDNGKIEQMVDRLKGVTRFEYEDTDNPPNNDSEVITTVTDALTHKTTYRMNGYGNPTEITNAKNLTTRMHWDDDHNVDRLEEPNGAVTSWSYEDNGLLVSKIDAVNNAIKDPSKRKSQKLEYQYSKGGHVADLVKKTSPEGRVHTFTYDSTGNLLSVTDPKGNATEEQGDYTTTYTYYGKTGLLNTVTDANGGVTTYGDSDAQNYGYDQNGYPTMITDALKQETRYQYGKRGEVLSITDAKGKKSEYTYDVFNRPLTSKVPKDQEKGEYIVTPAPVYDQNDNVISQIAPNGAKSDYAYDAVDQMVAANEPKDSDSSPVRKTTYEFDLIGNLVKQTEPKGNLSTDDPTDFTTTYIYDELDQLISTTNSKNHKITYEYDKVGNTVKITEPIGNETEEKDDYTSQAKFDLNHRVIEEIDSKGSSIKYVYDHDSNRTQVVNKEGRTLTTVYDERGLVEEMRIPHEEGKTAVMRYEYDEVGNRTKVIAPRGMETADTDDFTQKIVYDALNREKEIIYPIDPSSDNPRDRETHKLIKYYDEVGNLMKVSAPSSEGQKVRNDNTYTYFDNGWVKSSSDPWDIQTSFEYNENGLQTKRTLTSAGGSSSRTMSWSYYPDGKLKSKSDDGFPVGEKVALVDNSDKQNIESTNNWETADAEKGYHGYNYFYSQKGNGQDQFSWKLHIPESGEYTVYIKYPARTDSASDAPFTIEHEKGTEEKTINQKENAGEWVSIGKYTFDEKKTGKLTLTDKANGTVIADAVKLVRDKGNTKDEESKQLDYYYDANANLIKMTDSSSGSKTDTYEMIYTELNEVLKVEELKDGKSLHTTTYSYDVNGNAIKRQHDQDISEYVFNELNQVEKVTNKENGNEPKVTTYEYTKNGLKQQEKKGNGNVVTYSYYWDNLLKQQTEKKPDGTIVNQHSLEYNADGHKVKDTLQMLDADNKSVNSVLSYRYNPMGQIVEYTKTGDNAKTETYVHDANGNVIEETIDGKKTNFNYDRNRLQTMETGGVTVNYNYDPTGRLDTVTANDKQLEKYKYDGFDRVSEHQQLNEQGNTEVTSYTYDPLDRTVSQTVNAEKEDAKTTNFNYLGLSDNVLNEEIAGEITKSYQYSPWGERLSMVKYTDNEQHEDSYYGYNPHTDVETLTDENGSTRATYGYTAYGQNDEKAFTGVDKPEPNNPDQEPYNNYRYNSKRWDPATKQYDMGFRNYDPGLNRFLSRDMYNGALSDMSLTTDPYTNNPYAFAGGNPITNVEYDGHFAFVVVLIPITAEAVGWAVAGTVAVVGTAAVVDQASKSDVFEGEEETTQTQTKAETATKDIAAEVKAHVRTKAKERGEENQCTKALKNPNVSGQVPYGCTDLSLMVINQRAEDAKNAPNNRRKNAILNGAFTYAAVEYVDKNGQVQRKTFRNVSHNEIRSNPEKYQGVPGQGVHAEGMMDHWLQDNGITPDRVRRIYVEQQPCSTSFKCDERVSKYSSKGTKVTYSFYTEADKKAVVKALFSVIRGLFGL
ncbi:RHS repeat-associated core domain-containing protein [Bacillus sp. SA1-12]|uniref:golvesin C-terminal-like domain-containing protein n=1 Tax=Bacillus sp. SA1-12 TaxID=1455638 RepID=UPI0006964975|nr:RHS repeat-associated core domain-containing protein [Bacillus sp. SA1-12]